jgi:hypothetical protein
MKLFTRITKTVKDAYWEAVADCLVDLFHLSPSDAHRLCTDRRAEVEFAPRSVRSSIFYHKEPFDIATDLSLRYQRASAQRSAQTAASLADPGVRQSYEAILVRHGLS